MQRVKVKGRGKADATSAAIAAYLNKTIETDVKKSGSLLQEFIVKAVQVRNAFGTQLICEALCEKDKWRQYI